MTVIQKHNEGIPYIAVPMHTGEVVAICKYIHFYWFCFQTITIICPVEFVYCAYKYKR